MTQDVAVQERAAAESAARTYEELDEAYWTPPVDIWETDDEIVLRAALPGVRKEDISLEAREGVLMLSGRCEARTETSFLRRELPYGRFYRSFALPDGVKTAEVQAKHECGLLEIRLPKSEEAKPHKVEIK